MADFLKDLRELVGGENFFDSRADLVALKSRPGFGRAPENLPLPEAAATPVNLAQVLDIFKLCRAHSREINIFGSGSRPVVYRPKGEYILLSTTRLSRVIDIDPANRIVAVQAGARINALNEAIRGAGLYFPQFSNYAPSGTIGGALAANVATVSGEKYGPIGSFALELEIVAGSLKRLCCSGQNGQPGKLVPSFPLAPLFCGSFGCLGLIGAVALKALPIPEKLESLIAVFPEDIRAAEAVAGIAQAPVPPERLLIESRAASFLANAGDDKARLFISYAGSRGDVGSALARARDILKNCGVLEIMSPERAPVSLPAALGKLKEPYLLVSFSALPSRLPAAAEAVEKICRENGSRFLFYGSPPNLTFALTGKESEKAKREIFHLELTLNNRLHSEDDLALDKAPWSKQRGEITDISSEIRKIFDPYGLFAGAPYPDEEECW
ncbi:MAG: FAD-binding oxidoreductase [Desulfovibrio sp.]|nr:FAD-binding oxidoreductase [Desulfovibrio sp.]